MRRRVIGLSTLGLALFTAAAQAQVGVPPPTFGALSSTQTGGALHDYEIRDFRTFQLNSTVNVPAEDVQALLPDGYYVDPGTLVPVILSPVFGQRTEITRAVNGVPAGAYGPAALFQVIVRAHRFTAGDESLIVYSARSNQDSVNRINDLFEGDIGHVADDLSTEIEEEGDLIRYTVTVKESGIGLKLKLQGKTGGPIVDHAVVTLNPLPFRFLAGRTPTRQLRLGQQQDYVVTPTAGHFALTATDTTTRETGVISLPGGKLHIVSVAPSFTLSRWNEITIKLEPGL